MSRRGRGSRWVRVGRWAFLALIGAVWARTLWRQGPYVRAYEWQVSWPWLAVALGLLLAQMGTLGVAWGRLLHAVGWTTPVSVAASVWLRAQIARYLPGGLWDVAGRAVLGRAWAVPPRATSAAAVLEVAFQVLAAGLFLVVTLVFAPVPAVTRYVPWLLAGMGVLAGTVLSPLFPRGVNAVLRRWNRPPLAVDLSPRVGLQLLALYVLAHACQGAGFGLFVRGLTPVPISLLPLLAAAYVAAWLVGYVVILAPTGIGVREAALVVLVQAYVAAPVALAAALGYRVWLTLRDALAALGGLGLAWWATQRYSTVLREDG